MTSLTTKDDVDLPVVIMRSEGSCL